MRERRSEDRATGDSRQIDRRQFLGVGTGVGVTLLAGCTGQSDRGTSGDDGSTDGSTDSETSTGSFRLLISDRPADIGDFDSLNVSFDRARVFSDKDDDEEDDQAENDSETQDETNETEIQDETNEPETQNETNETEEDNEPRDDEEGDEGAGGFSVIDLGGATVDLTEVVGEKAIGVFDGELEAGQYSKIELYASNVEGVVDGDSVDVKIPSGKLQITKPFEITADEPVSFVFDINVVKKGNKAAYNLLPVISESGVAGKDVDVEEVEKGRGKDKDDENEDEEDDADDEDETNSTADGDDTNSTAAGGNETAGDGEE
jgi:hypothetical protein